MFGGKKNLDLGIIIGENSHHFLSFDEYAEHFLLPFSPRLCNIDYAVSSLSSIGINNIVIFAKRDSDIILNYLARGWPLIKFYIFDYVDIREKFIEFMSEYTKEHSLELIAIMNGNYPVWFDMNSMKSQLERVSNIAITCKYGRKNVVSGVVVEKDIFVKKYESIILDEANLEVDMMEKMTAEFGVHTMEAQGYITPFGSLKEYYDIHMQMIDDYLIFDQFNAYVPIRGSMSLNISSNLGKGSHIIHSIVGENVEISGKVENSVIFSNVKIGKHAYIKNSLILPGNNIGTNAQVINSVIDEFSEDNTLPNIQAYSIVGNEKPSAVNQKFPDILNFGVTLIGKDVRIPSGIKIGANCYIDSFVQVSAIKARKKLSDGSFLLRDAERD